MANFPYLSCISTYICPSVPKSSVQAKEQTVKNVIFMIPDGFSSTYATGYRWYKGKSSIMDDMLVGMHRTYSASSAVTDSAAGGTCNGNRSKNK